MAYLNLRPLTGGELRRAAWLTVGLSTVLAVGATAWRASLRPLPAHGLAAGVAAPATSGAVPAPGHGQQLPGADFVARLPPYPGTEALMAQLDRLAKSQGVAVLGVDVVPNTGSAETLGRVDVTLTLQGRYAALRAVVGELFASLPNVVVRQLSLKRRSGAPGDLEAVVALAVLGRPPSAAPAVGAGS